MADPLPVAPRDVTWHGAASAASLKRFAFMCVMTCASGTTFTGIPAVFEHYTMEVMWTMFVEALEGPVPFVEDMWQPSLAIKVAALCVFLVSTTYAVHGGLWLVLDVYHVPAFLYKYKLQKVPFDPSTLPRMWKFLLLGSVTGLMPSAVVFGWAAAQGRIRISRELPALSELVAHFAVFVLMEEVMFFYSHKALHTPLLYARVHKVHHEHKQPIALAAGYAHPVESFVGNVLPLFVQPLLVRAHLATAFAWMVAATVVTQIHHTGFRMPWNLGSQPDFHDFHHMPNGFKSNYGLLGILDYLHGSDKPYKKFLKERAAKAKQN